jgi:hypothetical protein
MGYNPDCPNRRLIQVERNEQRFRHERVRS